MLAAFHRDDLRGSEAGLKYFVLGALSSGMLLYGASLLYGFSGTVVFAGIAAALQRACRTRRGLRPRRSAAGLAFKMSAVPFHMWTPDVYEGAPTPVTAFFATAPKMAAVAMTVRVVITAVPGITAQWQQIIVFISIAVDDARLVRGHRPDQHQAADGLFVDRQHGLRAGRPRRRHRGGRQGVLIYMAIYLVMTLGTFAAILSMRSNGRTSRTSPT